jgi:hypothetical protein
MFSFTYLHLTGRAIAGKHKLVKCYLLELVPKMAPEI